MYIAVRENFYWPNLKKEVEEYVKTCKTCQTSKATNQRKAGLLKPLPVPVAAWEHISMDFVIKLPKTARGFTAIMVVVDRLSKQAHLVPTRDEATSSQTAQKFLERIFPLHGMPLSIVSDRNSKFTAEFWSELMRLVGTSLNMSSARHPESDGQTERTIRTITQYLRSFVKYNQKDWDLWLPLAEFCYNSASHSATGMSPFQVNYGRQPLTPLAFTKAKIETSVPEVEELLTKYQGTRTLCKRILEGVGLGPFAEREEVVTQEEVLARKAILEQQKKMKKQADKTRREVTFEVGEQVLLSTKEFDRKQYTGRPSRKLGPKYIGPYKVAEVLGEGAYRLALPQALALHPVFHVSQLRKFFNLDQFPDRPKKEVRAGDFKQNKNKAVEKITGRRTRMGVLQYKVRWKNTAEEAWVPAKSLEDAHQLIVEAEEQWKVKKEQGRE